MKSAQQQKLWMASTGLFLCIFLVIHLLGNLQLLLPANDARIQFNWYSHFLSTNIFIKIVEIVLLISLIGHIGYAAILTRNARAANGSRYHYDKRGVSSKWYSRNMGILGTVILLFLVIHLKDFWYQYKFHSMPLDENNHTDLYQLVISAYREWWYVLIYVAGMIALGFHLLHGFFSAARTLGVYHPRYVNLVRWIGWIYTGAITAGFIVIPLYIHFINY